MELIRGPRTGDGPYVAIPRAAIEDVEAGRLTLTALGLLGELLTLPPDQPITDDTTEWLETQGTDDLATIQAALAELEARGYYRPGQAAERPLADSLMPAAVSARKTS